MLGSDCRRYYYDKKQIAKSVEAFKLALDINPMYEGIWFTLGWAADLNDQGSSKHMDLRNLLYRDLYIYMRGHTATPPWKSSILTYKNIWLEMNLRFHV